MQTAAGETNLEVEGAGTGTIHIADSSLFVPAVSASPERPPTSRITTIRTDTRHGGHLEQFVVGRAFGEVVGLACQQGSALGMTSSAAFSNSTDGILCVFC